MNKKDGDFVSSISGHALLKEYWFDEPMKVKDWSENLRSAIK